MLKKENFKNFLFSIIVTCAFCYLCSIELSNILFFLPTFIVVLFFFIKTSKKNDVYIVVLACVLSFLLWLGKYVVYIYESSGVMLWIKSLITLLGCYLFFNQFLYFLFNKIDSQSNGVSNYSNKKVFIISFLVILVCWIPMWLAEYPGSFNPDTMTQMYQALGERSYNNMNPLLHTLYIEYLIKIVKVFVKDINKCLFVVEFIQMIINSLIYAYVVLHIYKRTKNKIITIFSICFFALVSYNVYYNVTISKDGSYAAMLVLFIVLLDDYLHSPTKGKVLPIIAIGLIYSLTRANGYYSLIMILLIALILLIFKKSKKKKVFVILCVILLLSTIIKGPIYNIIINNSVETIEQAENIDDSDNDDEGYVFRGSFLYVIPFQQVANVVAKGRELNEKEEWLIEEYIDLEKVSEVYNPILVDPLFSYIENNVKNTRNGISNIEYIKLWIELFLKYPQDYIEAYVNMNRYYFYPNRYVIMYVTGVTDNSLGINSANILDEKIKNTIETYYDNQHNIPVLGSIYSPGVVTFILLIALTYQLRKKQYDDFLVLTPILINFLILMVFVPLNDEFRYFYPISACLPFIISTMFIDKKVPTNE